MTNYSCKCSRETCRDYYQRTLSETLFYADARPARPHLPLLRANVELTVVLLEGELGVERAAEVVVLVALRGRHAHRLVIDGTRADRGHAGLFVEHVREQRDQRVQLVLELVRDLARVGVELPEDEDEGPLWPPRRTGS